ncbi:MAG: ABC transporter ATP-binding protein [Armatimonadota bacterium]|jgi:lipopolysaccharide transport system ATP-binding protein
MPRASVVAENLGKQYRAGVQRGGYRTLREAFVDAMKSPWRRWQTLRGAKSAEGLFWALRDISFELHPGDVLGVIGPNGAGKTTLLKLLSRITVPTVGRAQIRGRLGSLLEVGTGFHPELTGRENIYLNGAVLGMTRTEVERKFEQIVDFSGVSRFLDTPVKRYSSGMYVRLAFSVATHLEPEVLLVDEVLSVGDADFQSRSVRRMRELASGEGRTVLFVSHNTGAVARLCNRAMVLEAGRASYFDDVERAIDHYLTPADRAQWGTVDLRNAQGLSPDREPLILKLSVHHEDGTEATYFQTGETVLIRIYYELNEPVEAGYGTLHILSSLGERVMTLTSTQAHGPIPLGQAGCLECRIDDLRLGSGEYLLEVGIGEAFPKRSCLDYVYAAGRFGVELGDYLGGEELNEGLVPQRSQWKVGN